MLIHPILDQLKAYSGRCHHGSTGSQRISNQFEGRVYAQKKSKLTKN
jgi:hypothetical protein